MSSERNKIEEKSLSPKEVRQELILYLLQKYGSLQTKDIAKVLGHKPRTIRRTLKKLKESGEVESEKLGRKYIWAPSEDDFERSMYF
ncbi:hypothetical protein AKJ53_00850 [candidate division MSBL1 archaeon SCGC-AAA382F02]|uniref:HTH deoR-type domain-containing protein n=1 Tax=candidate division MSBL1 archaeon SCGC-AAA382F02 TaxID=1698282 RepID=A0A133VIN4_9EURY|nr:hypothetical protein AKJ53_00850 [candidate division MSBL1 archaeon SCGC-AAA382F02]